MDKIWLQQYPKGIPAEIDVDEYASLKDILERSCSKFAALPAYGNMGVSITYRTLDQASRDFGAYLQKVIGLRKGDRVAIMLPNLLQYPVALFGTLRAGLTVVNVNPMYTARELEHQLKDSGADRNRRAGEFRAHAAGGAAQDPDQDRHHDADRRLVSAAQGVAHQPRRKACEEDGAAVAHPGRDQVRGRIAAGRAQVLDDVPLTHDDIAFLQYTGGTTGVAKGAILTHCNLVANVQQVAAWIARDLLDGKETAILPLPLYHVYALTSNLVFMKIGAHVVLITNPRDMPAFIKTLGNHRVHGDDRRQYAVQRVAERPGFARLDDPQPQDGQCRWHGRPARGGREVEEGHLRAHSWKATGSRRHRRPRSANPFDLKDWTGTIGMPIPSTEAAILDDLGAEVAMGQVDEICIRGPKVMRGYWNRARRDGKGVHAGWLAPYR